MRIPKWVIIVVLVVLAVVLVGMGSKFGGTYYEDTNGDDFALQTITEDNIIKQDLDSTGFVGNVSAQTGKETFLGENFSGVKMIRSKSYSGEMLKIYANKVYVSEGNFRMVVVHDGEIVHEFKLNEPSQEFVLQNAYGRYDVVVAGEVADCSLDVEIE